MQIPIERVFPTREWEECHWCRNPYIHTYHARFLFIWIKLSWEVLWDYLSGQVKGYYTRFFRHREKKLNYQPDFTAINLSRKKSNIIGVVISTFDDSLVPIFRENHYYTEILGGMEYVFKNHKYDLFISGMMNPIEFKNWIQKRNLDGLIFFRLIS